MRLDKYLKVTRLIKRRTVANDACDDAKIMVNGKISKASYNVKIDDIIQISFGERTLKVKVVSITESIHKSDAPNMYEIIND